MTNSGENAGNFKEATEIQMLYAALANEALGSYLVDPGRYTQLQAVFSTAHQSLQNLWARTDLTCRAGQVHIGCQCWPIPR